MVPNNARGKLGSSWTPRVQLDFFALVMLEISSTFFYFLNLLVHDLNFIYMKNLKVRKLNSVHQRLPGVPGDPKGSDLVIILNISIFSNVASPYLSI